MEIPPVAMRKQTGFSLIELTVIVAILGITALVVIPDFSSTDPQRLELAANRVAEALRYAKREAIRTGGIRGVLVDTDDGEPLGKDITVFEPDLSASPFGILTKLTHPVSRQPYDFFLEQSSTTRGVEFASSAKPFSFEGVSGSQNNLFFTAQGVPVWVEDSVLSRFTGGDIQLTYGGQDIIITIQPVTGRVMVQ